MLLRNPVALGYAIALVAIGTGFGQQNGYVLDDLGKEVRLRSVEISPGGEQIVVIASRPDYNDNQFVNQLFLIDVAGSDVRPLTFDRPNIREPQWSPAGKRIAFVAANKKGKQQVFVMDMRGGEAQDVTKFEGNVWSFCWAPDGRTLAFIAAAPSSETAVKQKHNLAFEATRNSYLADSPARRSIFGFLIWIGPRRGN